jgi:DNA-directed RNA polymerase subunit RPC12/RpoP
VARIRTDARRRSPTGKTGRVLTPTPQITCIDCGGRCFLLSHPPEDGIWEPGDVIAYRCEDCLDRWDIVMSDEDDAEIARGDRSDN